MPKTVALLLQYCRTVRIVWCVSRYICCKIKDVYTHTYIITIHYNTNSVVMIYFGLYIRQIKARMLLNCHFNTA